MNSVTVTLAADRSRRLGEFAEHVRHGAFGGGEIDSPYWKEHRSRIQVEILEDVWGQSAQVTLSGDSGFYVPIESEPRLKVVARRSLTALGRGLAGFRGAATGLGLRDEPACLPYDRAYASAMRWVERQGLEATWLEPFPRSASAVREDFAMWARRDANDHVLLDTYLMFIAAATGVIAPKTRQVLEIGAGNGNLASLILNSVPSLAYVVVDLPETLLLSIAYLSALFPEREVTMPHEVQERGVNSSSLVFLTPGQVDLLSDRSIDAAINIHSFQEMHADQISRYFELMDRVSTSHAGMFVVNRIEKAPEVSEFAEFRAAVNRFYEYPWPSGWRCEFDLVSEYHRLVQSPSVAIRALRR